MSKKSITGIVLAGGKSSRMGTDKSLMMLKDKPLIQYAIDTLKPLCDQVVISSNKPVYDFTGCEVWPDIFPFQAPMIGIYSCLKRSETETNIVFSCDMPLVPAPFFEFILSKAGHHNIVVPSHDLFIEPLCGIYTQNILQSMEKFIKAENFKMLDFIKSTSHFLLEVNPEQFSSRIFLNINTIEDFNTIVANL